MKAALRSRVETPETPIGDKRTLGTLVARELLDSQGELTRQGTIAALELLSLRKQCEHLNLPLYTATAPIIDRPEQVCWQAFLELGFAGAYCEGGAFLTLIKSACLDTLAALNTFGSRADARTRFLEAQFVILKDHAAEILDAIASATRHRVEEAFVEVYSDALVREWYPSLTPGFVGELFAAVGPAKLAVIAEAIFEDPYLYRNGWPDLTLVRNGELRLVEIKTTDKLHRSQLCTLRRMMTTVPGRFAVIVLSQGPQHSFPRW